MGNTQSGPQNETRRSNRLSKPLTKKFNTFQTSQPLRSKSNSSQASGLIGWQNPWVGYNISNTPVEKRISYPKKAEIPPTLFEAEPSEESPTDEYAASTDDQASEKHQDRAGLLTTGSRRESYQPGSPDAFSPFSPVYEQPKRANSIQTPLQRQNSAVNENRDATSSNTHFLVGNQRFSLTRRRSLLTRPGVATRRTTGAIRRVPSPIGEPIDDPSESAVLQWPLPSTQRMRLPSPARPTSPTDARYTQLGALKLGSLRVVNGSASPCPSERVSLDRPGLGLENIEVVGPLRGSTLEIPALSDLKKPDDVPGSPFSFEKSPTITVRSRNKSLFPGDPDDEEIALCDDTRNHLEKSALDGLARSTSRSLNKSDSGYSSATSVHSMQRSRTRGSIDSQTSGSCGADSSKNVWISNLPTSSRPADSIQRHLSLEERPENYSRLLPASHRWYDSSNPTPVVQTRSRRSTLCAPRFTEYPSSCGTRLEAKPAVESPYLSMPHHQQGFTRGPLYGDRLSVDMLDVISSTGSSANVEKTLSYQKTIAGNKEQLRRSASAYHIHEKNDTFVSRRSRSRSQKGSRIWSLRPGVEAPPLPTILSPGDLQNNIDADLAASEPIRGRPRSRSNDYRPCRLTKSRPQSDVHMTTSPFALY
ncbi:uncharacterized protein N7446_002828 [Penicillium canescens]|uniref:Uncharacterized protein n=1 Tax=Penicillium canescens TaxID=5083 RepID=A0AAD6NB35_PENCN|nr:uncharacterized protein N7446_002828 [Penicillium canescens]KAJ6044635.1 hypothetical protein N7460_005990 [Penicillium canescens]KAJ6056105.1 hypothetical protein N7444_005203 [Penicillium canescens]KAJ6075051.1 hypothetical protein N7446_002828 [Penicillium canescens]